jgi:E1A-binding protein p400
MVEAASALQPCGLTIADAKPMTPVPFLLKHTLREYQHIGLDWLVSPIVYIHMELMSSIFR